MDHDRGTLALASRIVYIGLQILGCILTAMALGTAAVLGFQPLPENFIQDFGICTAILVALSLPLFLVLAQDEVQQHKRRRDV